MSGNGELTFYIAVMVGLIAVVWGIERVVQLSMGALWCLSIWGLAHLIGGLVPAPEGWPVVAPEHPVVYKAWLIPGRLRYDHIVHVLGSALITWVCWQGLGAAMRTRGAEASPTVGLLGLTAAASIGLGALNEVVEFAATLLVPETTVGGYRNTGGDLVANVLGATIAVVMIRLQARSTRQAGVIRHAGLTATRAP